MLDAPFRMIVPHVFQARLRGSSVFLLVDRRVTLIDAGPPGALAGIRLALRRVERTLGDVERILITHYHIDHAGGLAALQRFAPARAGAHAIEAPYVQGARVIPVPIRHPLLSPALTPLGRWMRPAAARVDIVLRDGDELPVLGGLRVVHTPGHTPGHIALHLPEQGLLIAGDALQVRDGRLTPPHRLFTEDRRVAVESLRRLAAVPFEVLALSHFPPQRHGTRARLARLAGG